MRATAIFILICFSLSIQAQTTNNSKSLYYQSFKQVIDSSYSYNWNDADDKWELVEKDQFIYDTIGVLETRISSIKNDLDEFEYIHKKENKLLNHDIVESTYSFYEDEEWFSDYKVYNSGLTDTSYVFDTINETYTYHYIVEKTIENEQIVSVIEKSWDTTLNQWINYSKSDFTYSSTENTETRYLWDTAKSIWYLNTKLFELLNTSALVDTLLEQVYDTVAETWNDKQRIINTYESGNLISSEIQFYNDPEWINFSMDSNVYITSLKEKRIRQYWNMSSLKFDLFSQNVYSYNYLNNLEEDIFQQWDSIKERWIDVNKVSHFYSDIICTLTNTLEETSPISCYNANDGQISLSIEGGTEPIEVLWNTGETDLILENIAANSYYVVEITDANKCVVSDSILIENPDSISVSLEQIDHVTCYGNSDGSIEIITEGGTGELEYSWNDNSETTTSDIQNLPVGIYSVIVSDQNECSSIHQFEITQPDSLIVNVVELENVSCFGFDDGVATISVSGGTLPYQYEWLEYAIEDSTINILKADQYNYFLVTDAHACEFFDSVIVIQPDSVSTSAIAGFNAAKSGDMIEYSVEPTDRSRYYWNVDLGNVKYGDGTHLVLIEWTDIGDGMVSVIEETDNGCYGDTIYFPVAVSENDVSINEIENDFIKAFPNPFTERLTVSLKNGLVANSYRILDIDGRTVQYKNKLNQNTFIIHRNGLNKGIYFLEIVTDKSYLVRIVIK